MTPKPQATKAKIDKGDSKPKSSVQPRKQSTKLKGNMK